MEERITKASFMLVSHPAAILHLLSHKLISFTAIYFLHSLTHFLSKWRENKVSDNTDVSPKKTKESWNQILMLNISADLLYVI